MKSLMTILIAFVYISCNQGTANNVLTPEFFKQKLEQAETVQLVDVRTPEEYNEGHLKQAQLITLNTKDFDKKLNELNKDQPVMVYCRSGSRSAKAAEIMTKLGFKEVYDLGGGIMNWQESGLPVVKD